MTPIQHFMCVKIALDVSQVWKLAAAVMMVLSQKSHDPTIIIWKGGPHIGHLNKIHKAIY